MEPSRPRTDKVNLSPHVSGSTPSAEISVLRESKTLVCMRMNRKTIYPCLSSTSVDDCLHQHICDNGLSPRLLHNHFSRAFRVEHPSLAAPSNRGREHAPSKQTFPNYQRLQSFFTSLPTPLPRTQHFTLPILPNNGYPSLAHSSCVRALWRPQTSLPRRRRTPPKFISSR